jgi:hypothetical protein
MIKNCNNLLLDIKKVMKLTYFLLVFIYVISNAQSRLESGLIGKIYDNLDTSRILSVVKLEELDQVWNVVDQGDWSGEWMGILVAPFSGKINFFLKTDKRLSLVINDVKVAVVERKESNSTGSYYMKEGEVYHVVLKYVHEGRGKGFQEIRWSWGTNKPAKIDKKYFGHRPEHKNYYDSLANSKIDYSNFLQVDTKNIIVCSEPGRFAGWPSNGGLWSWDNEILIGFGLGYYKNAFGDHSIDYEKPQEKVLARSLDGGETWKWFDPENYEGDVEEPVALKSSINFTHPDFVLRVDGEIFFTSYDRGNKWQGPFAFPNFGKKLTSRTDYIVNSERDCHLFFSAKEEKVKANLQDRAFCVRTADGGKTFNFLGWMTGEPLDVRSVMPSSVRISENELISAIRRKVERKDENNITYVKNWIDVYDSKDNGITWNHLSFVAETDKGSRNGNPPSLIKLKDGRLCITYGYRSVPYGIRAKLSSDKGKTWSKEIILRDDARTWDIGYPCSVQRPDGKIVTIYYYSNDENPEQHIAASIWDPDTINTYKLY